MAGSSRATALLQLAFVLLLMVSSTYVYRSFALLIGLALTIGQQAGLSCLLKCDRPAAAASECQHDGSPTRFTTDDECRTDVPEASAFLSQSPRRSPASTPSPIALLVARSHCALPVANLIVGGDRRNHGPGTTLPLVTALRI